MGSITPLRPVECPSLDTERLRDMTEDLGPAEAEQVLVRAMEEMADLVAEMIGQYHGCRLSEFARGLRSLSRLAEHAGLPKLAAVAQDVGHCLSAGDDTALAATWGRLVRLAARSFATEWAINGSHG
ncbi:MAG: hypothetical protein R3D84_00865 [Paracoccaceae bacterium]